MHLRKFLLTRQGMTYRLECAYCHAIVPLALRTREPLQCQRCHSRPLVARLLTWADYLTNGRF